jgi:hypothetical protein
MPIAASGLLKTTGGPDMFLHISALQSAGIDPDHKHPRQKDRGQQCSGGRAERQSKVTGPTRFRGKVRS